MTEYCTFCEIVAGRLPSRVVHEEADILVFRNRLDWFPTQLLIVPKEHMTQEGLWASGELMGRIGQLAVELGSESCEDGYRIVSNFGDHGLQTVEHGHVHLIGGKFLGLYVFGKIPMGPFYSSQPEDSRDPDGQLQNRHE